MNSIPFSGAYWFYGIEKPFENERYNAMVDEHNRIIASVNYLANYLSDLHYKYDIINSEGRVVGVSYMYTLVIEKNSMKLLLLFQTIF